ncbi:MAG: ABC transporter ATP-binding protein [Candidatus Omnitrophota bacterium]|nr:MAG: ABC transporter ATP-binding protein [Candidatus Omnitrophota bacterium]
MEGIIEVKNLNVTYTGIKEVQALREISFCVGKGEILGVVGESGSGKSTLAYAFLNLLPSDSKKTGRILFNNEDILSLKRGELEKLRGRQVSMIFQEPAATFNPVLSIGYQFEEILDKRAGIKRKDDRRKIITDSFNKVRLADYTRIMRSYPHQLSGGQLQRASIAMAISLKPAVLIADEPTSSLDVTIESQIINLFRDLRDSFNLTIIFITHNLDLVKALCDRAVVLYQGEIREIASSRELFVSPKDNYTVSLIKSFKELE